MELSSREEYDRLIATQTSDPEEMESSDYQYSILKEPGENMDAADKTVNCKSEEKISVNKTGKLTSSSFVWILAFFSAIGGFLFGYDTGVISGAMLLLRKRFELSSLWQEIIVSIAIAGAFIGALFGGFLNDKFGRKATTVLASLVFAVGAVILGAAQNVEMLVSGRAVLGLGIGLASMTVPVYIAECAPCHIRGKMVTLNVLFITGGQFIASVIDGAFSYMDDGWRYMLGLAAIPALIQCIGFIFLPESPRWLVSKNKEVDARDVLIAIRNTRNIDQELDDIKTICEEERRAKAISGGGLTIIRMLKNSNMRKALVVGCGLQLFQQLSGINTVMYYSASIIKMAGISNEHEAIWLSAVTSSINFIFTLVGVWAVDRFGRRPLILTSLLGVIISCIVLAVGFQLAAINSPHVSQYEMIGDNSSCTRYSYCENCIEDTSCGFCFTESGEGRTNGSCLSTRSTDNTHSIYGRCNNTDLPGDLVWAYEYCPTSYSWIILLGLVLYLMCFAPGMGPMPWTYNSEIYPLWARSTGNSFSSATNWLSNLLVSMTFLTLTETLTKYGTYWLFVGICLVALVFFTCVLPETKGRQLEDVETLFQEPWCKCCSNKSRVDYVAR
ncbi:proton myo-inositol cotransporter isoform X1 [Patella vulgata]|uniref:proton myo-inositol cotransporter isoform X1 n=2 Tax=Patella vulgata TaxID=6465 RepID=UPI00218028B7|nr:proton myo-inositol cotransporter isoform X1 [Patella vulgata]XP_050411790.1 proton myo-inositol cotransporter isoform X1 [Patella vulgata]